MSTHPRFFRWWKNRTSLCALSLSMALLVGNGLSAFATPPSPAGQILIEDQRVSKGTQREGLKINLQFNEPVSSLNISAKARPVIEGRPDFQQPAALTILESRGNTTRGTTAAGSAARKAGGTEAVTIPLGQLKPGTYTLEISVQGRNTSGGFSDKQIRRLIIDASGGYQILGLDEVLRQHTEEQKQAFEKQLRQDPKSPDIRLLMDSATDAPAEAQKTASFDVAEASKLLVRATNVSERFSKYIQEKEATSWSSIDPITVKGRLTFLDTDGNWRPLVNVSVHVWDDDTFGDEHLASVATDWNGNWSVSVNNDDGFLQDGRDIYYTFKLENTRLRLGACGGDTYEWKSEVHDDLKDGVVVDFGTDTAGTNTNSLPVWSSLNLAWNHATSAGGQDPGFIPACFPGTGTNWNGQRISIEAGFVDGPDVIMHEYGHGLMERANGSNNSPGGPHNFGQCNQDQRLSWSEGWATGFMLSARPDGVFNWHNGDTGQTIENFSSSCQLGETSEGRVAAALYDFMDGANDTNGGNLNQGRSETSDDNSANRISLATLFRDTLWGVGPHNNMLNFWTDLSDELVAGAQRNGGENIMWYNWMSVPQPVRCAATKVAMMNIERPEESLVGLRAFRDLALKRSPNGRQLINLYYRNSPEMARILLENPQALPEAVKVITYFSDLGDTIGHNERYKRAFAANQPLATGDIQKSLDTLFGLMEQQGGDSLRKDIARARRTFDGYRTLSLPDFQQAVSKEKEGLKAGDYGLIDSSTLSPESKRALEDPKLKKVLERDAFKPPTSGIRKPPIILGQKKIPVLSKKNVLIRRPVK